MGYSLVGNVYGFYRVVVNVAVTVGHLLDFCPLGFTFSADFGLSKIMDDQVTMRTVCGTPGYCGETIYVTLYTVMCVERKTSGLGIT